MSHARPGTLPNAHPKVTRSGEPGWAMVLPTAGRDAGAMHFGQRYLVYGSVVLLAVAAVLFEVLYALRT